MNVFYVVCPVYETGPYNSEKRALRQREEIIALGGCHHEHEVVERPGEDEES